MQHLVANGHQMGMGAMSDMGNGNGMLSPSQEAPEISYPLYLLSGTPASAPLQLNVKRGEIIRMRLINAAAATIFRVALGGHHLTVTHSDGQPVEPIEGDVVRLGMGERYDCLISANHPGVWQLAAQVEGTTRLARSILRYQGSTAPAPQASYQPPELAGQLLGYHALRAAPATRVPPGTSVPDQVASMTLGGGMGDYVWTINGQVFPQAEPIVLPSRQHIRFHLKNMSMMPHPIHLHGHSFQVENGTGRGPLKDTVLVEPMQQLTIDWTSDNPGKWAFHCHNLYHMMVLPQAR
jgi:FtsP/CotA-like multicopper oxidase with cupredoxin domain